MKNFDTDRAKRLEQDRSFTINGHTFRHKPAVAPEAVAEWSAMVGGEHVERDSDGNIRLDSSGDPISSLTEQEAIEILDRTILAFLEAGQDDAWKAARAVDAENPINLQDLRDLVAWLFEVTSGRPTGQSSGSPASTSGNGNSPSETTSTDVSPLPVASGGSTT